MELASDVINGNMNQQLPSIRSMIYYLIELPDDLFKQQILKYLRLNDIVQFDNAVTDYNYRNHYLNKIHNTILADNEYMNRKEYDGRHLLKLNWLYSRNIYLIHMSIPIKIINNEIINIKDLFKYCEELNLIFKTLEGEVLSSLSVLEVFISSFTQLKNLIISGNYDSKDHEIIITQVECILQNCVKLIAFDISGMDKLSDNITTSISHFGTKLVKLSIFEGIFINSASIFSLLEHFIDLKELKLENCDGIRIGTEDDSIVLYENIFTIPDNCKRLTLLSLAGCSKRVTDVSLRSIAKNCKELLSLSLGENIVGRGGIMRANQSCDITDDGLIAVSQECKSLKFLELDSCSSLTDTSIISIARHCTGLQSLNLSGCHDITDASLISLAQYCRGLQSLDISFNYSSITDAGIISISQHCTELQSLDVSCCDISDASIISILTNCKGLKILKLRSFRFKSDSITNMIPHMKQIQYLKLDHSNISDNEVLLISKHCPNLHSFHLARCKGIVEIIDTVLQLQQYCQNIKLLDLRSCNGTTAEFVNRISEFALRCKILYYLRK